MKNTLVYGASLNPARYSNLVIRRLVESGFTTMAYGRKAGEVAGIKIKTDLNDFKEIEILTLYLNPKNQKDHYDPIIKLQPQKVIFNPGTENPEFYDLLIKVGIAAENACTLVLLSTGQYH